MLVFCGTLASSKTPTVPNFEVDPFDPASCIGDQARLQDFVKYFEPGTAQARIKPAKIHARERSWNRFTGVGPWQVTTIPEQPFVKIHTYRVGGSDYTDTIRSVEPVDTVLVIEGEQMLLKIANFAYPYFDGTQHTGLICRLSTDQDPVCESQFTYPSIVNTREGSEFTEVRTGVLRQPYRDGEPLAFEGVLTSQCLRLAARYLDEGGGVEREFVIGLEFPGE